MDSTQLIGITAGILTASSMLPQVVKTIKEKKADEVSLLMLCVLIAGVSLWIVYGFKRDDLPIIATNFFSLAVNLTMVILRIRYGGNKDKTKSQK